MIDQEFTHSRHLSGRGSARAEDARGTPTKNHPSPSILEYEKITPPPPPREQLPHHPRRGAPGTPPATDLAAPRGGGAPLPVPRAPPCLAAAGRRRYSRPDPFAPRAVYNTAPTAAGHHSGRGTQCTAQRGEPIPENEQRGATDRVAAATNRGSGQHGATDSESRAGGRGAGVGGAGGRCGGGEPTSLDSNPLP